MSNVCQCLPLYGHSTLHTTLFPNWSIIVFPFDMFNLIGYSKIILSFKLISKRKNENLTKHEFLEIRNFLLINP